MTSENVDADITDSPQQDMSNNSQRSKSGHFIVIPIILIIQAELLLFSGETYYSICLHVLTLFILVSSTIWLRNLGVYKPLQALMLLPLLRLVNLSMPVFFDTTLYYFISIYTPLIIPIYLIARQQEITLKQLGITSKNISTYIPLAVLAGLIIAQGEYHVVTANYLIPDLSFGNILKLSIVMILFVGLIEELIFRSILQTRMEEYFGMQQGVIIASILFGIMHSWHGTPYEILFTSLVGLLIGYMFQRTRSLPLAAITHGSVNIFLFGLFPHLGPGLGII